MKIQTEMYKELKKNCHEEMKESDNREEWPSAMQEDKVRSGTQSHKTITSGSSVPQNFSLYSPSP
jgi:hypothetical protein